MEPINIIPNEFICPITLTIMSDPVICDDGYSYERNAIQSITNNISPMTRQPINKNNLIPNRALKDSIDRFLLNDTLIIDVNTNQIDQLIIPDYEKKIVETRSPYNDKLYKITYGKPNNWSDTRVKTTLVAVLDTSGSMGESCSLSNDGEQDGFSRLNLVQHSMNTVIGMLQPGDELVLIQFNSSSQYLFNQTINIHNKQVAKSIIDSLTPCGGTYVWNGLKLAYDAIINAQNENIHIMLLTDGQSTDDPFSELKKYLNRNTNEKIKKIKLTTFGFSYDINSKSLFNIAEYTNAGFNFIPDASMVGTVFCNYLANILCPDLFVPHVEQIDRSDELITFCDMDLELQYELIRYNCYEMLKNVCQESSDGRYLTNDIKNCVTAFEQFLQRVYVHNKSELIENMLKDFISDDDSQEQITKAISRQDWFKKWGHHYLLSLSCAHLTKQCHNYKDQGVQLYGNPKFQQLQEDVYDLFVKIPPPKPHGRAQIVRTSMSTYVDSSGGCFGPNCKIKLNNGSMKPLNMLTGDEILDGGHKIKYIVITKIPSGKMSMCQINDLIISDYHPMYHLESNSWIFPNQLANPTILNMDCMYNIVLESEHWVNIENYRCITLGHGLKEFNTNNHILQHEYFGTNKVIDNIEKYGSFCQTNNKIVILNNNNVYRDVKTNLVVSMAQNDLLWVN